MHDSPPILIRNAEVNGQAGRDLLVAHGRIAAIGAGLDAPAAAEVVHANGGALLPGLNDHHIHLAALAAARGSVDCGPPAAASAQALADLLRRRARAHAAKDWIRGIGYHESVAGELDAARLDGWVAHCPLRVQHRGGRLWVFNARALELLQPGPDAPLERRAGRLTGRLIDGDVWLRQRLQALDLGGFPDLAPVSRELAQHGITGVTDTTPHNNPETLARLAAAQARGELLQDVQAMGNASLDAAAPPQAGLRIGAHKFHLLESALPDFDVTSAAVAASHRAGRGAAFHCVTRAELVFALAVLRAAGVQRGDRIEHAAVTPPELLADLAELGLPVITQPAFVAERGDQYLRDVAAADQPWLYRLRGFLEADIPLSGSSDAPFAQTSPWAAMQASVSRCARSGMVLGAGEALTPEQALALYTAPLDAPGAAPVPLQAGEVADLCLLAQSWSRIRTDLANTRVRLTLRAGTRIWSSAESSPSG